MKITIDETKDEVVINDFLDESERDRFYSFMREFNLLRIKAKEDTNI